MKLLCALGIHAYPRFVNAHTQAPAPVRCERCGKAYGSHEIRRQS